MREFKPGDLVQSYWHHDILAEILDVEDGYLRVLANNSNGYLSVLFISTEIVTKVGVL